MTPAQLVRHAVRYLAITEAAFDADHEAAFGNHQLYKLCYFSCDCLLFLITKDKLTDLSTVLELQAQYKDFAGDRPFWDAGYLGDERPWHFQQARQSALLDFADYLENQP